jgi:hypothetical protein
MANYTTADLGTGQRPHVLFSAQGSRSALVSAVCPIAPQHEAEDVNTDLTTRSLPDGWSMNQKTYFTDEVTSFDSFDVTARHARSHQDS